MCLKVHHRCPKQGNLQFIIYWASQKYHIYRLLQNTELLLLFRCCCHMARLASLPHNSRYLCQLLFPQNISHLLLLTRVYIWSQCLLMRLVSEDTKDLVVRCWGLVCFLPRTVDCFLETIFSIFWRFQAVFHNLPHSSRISKHLRNSKSVCVWIPDSYH